MVLTGIPSAEIADQLTPHLSCYQDLIAIAKVQKLLDEIIGRIQWRFAQIPNLWSIHLLFKSLTADIQQQIIHAKFDDLYRELDRNSSLEKFLPSLKPAAMEYFYSLYLPRLSADISTYEELQKKLLHLKKNESDERLLVPLASKLLALTQSPSETLDGVAIFSDTSQLLLLEHFSEPLEQLVRPDKFEQLSTKLKNKATASFCAKDTVQIATSLNTVSDCLNTLRDWQNHVLMQAGILDKSRFRLRYRQWGTFVVVCLCVTPGTAILVFC
ncbi:MAG: hypothetical protein ACRCXC_05685 [Legionella sp.]